MALPRTQSPDPIRACHASQRCASGGPLFARALPKSPRPRAFNLTHSAGRSLHPLSHEPGHRKVWRERALNNNQPKSKGGKRDGAGRPKGAVSKATKDISAAAKEFTTDALNTLAKVMRDSESDAAKVAAANSILDRAYGKPKQALVGGDENDAPIKATLTVEYIG